LPRSASLARNDGPGPIPVIASSAATKQSTTLSLGTLIVYQPDDSFDVIDTLLVTSLTVNGRQRPRRRRA
jgi:hypothetical protein